MRAKPKLKIFDDETHSDNRHCSKSSLRISYRETATLPSESFRLIKMSSCRNLLCSMAEQEQAIRAVLSEEIKHEPLDEPVIQEGDRVEKPEADESLFKDLMGGRPQVADLNIDTKATPPQLEVDQNVVWPTPDVIDSTYFFTTPDKLQKTKSTGFHYLTNSRSHEPESDPIAKLSERLAEPLNPSKADPEKTTETTNQPKFYSEITNVKGRRFLVASFKESMQKLEDENNELRMKMLNSELEELRR
jgi:hypothetical protein